MKKLVSVFFTIFLIFAIGITANAAEAPLRLFSVDEEDGFSAAEVHSFALEKGFNGVLIDLSKNDSTNFFGEYLGTIGIEPFEIFILVEEEYLTSLKPGRNIVFRKDISEEAIAEYSESSGSDVLSFYLPFDDDEAFERAKYLYGKGYFKTIFIENLLSCHSEYGYEDYLLEISGHFPGAEIITINDLGRVLVPVAKGDFFGDAFELNNQYLINKSAGFGFCVSDFSALIENRNGSGSFLTDYFESTVLDEYADFSVSKKLEITRPTSSNVTVSTYQYSIFGTSDPEKPLYMNGTELERISSTGLFAVTVDVTKSAKKFTFSQGNDSVSVTIKFGSGSGGSGTTTKLTSCYPSASTIIDTENAIITLSCVGPSGGKVSAKIGEKIVALKQVAYADTGVPAKFTAEIDLSGDYPEDEVTSVGNVIYTLSYGGKTTEYESAGKFYFLGEKASFAIRANAELSGVERTSKENGDYITTLRTGCVDYVSEITENGWYKVSCGGYMKPSHCDIITGKTDLTNRISAVSREKGENYEKLILSCSELPAFKGNFSGKHFSITLYNTEWNDFSSTDMDSDLMYRINPVDNGDGSITINFFSKNNLWGWDVFTDPENKTFSIVLKGEPKLSDDPAKPLSGITVAVCSGHGGTDPGALSVAGEKGVNEAQINLANTMAIAESLENLGADIILLVAGEEKMDTYARTDPARYGYSDVYICCHANSIAENAPANLWCGTYVYYHYDHSAEFAKKLCDYISASTKRDNEGSESGYYSVTRLTLCPAVMLEVGFVSNPKELESLIDPADIQKTALAVTKAVLEICDN